VTPEQMRRAAAAHWAVRSHQRSINGSSSSSNKSMHMGTTSYQSQLEESKNTKNNQNKQ
jgi:hypothetical protein